MTLTLGGGPLSQDPPQSNYQINGPHTRLLFHPYPRRVRAVFAGQTVADTEQGRLLHQTGRLPLLFFPERDILPGVLRTSAHTSYGTACGQARHWSVQAGGRIAADAVWGYPGPPAAASWLRGYLTIAWQAMDAWYEEADQIEGEIRDPYHRIDVRASARHIRILAGTQVIADTRQAKILFETGLPSRYYIPPGDVRPGLLEPSSTQTICAYKGTASYHSLRLNGQLLTDAAWSYGTPLADASRVPGHLSFLHDALIIEIDGQPATPAPHPPQT